VSSDDAFQSPRVFQVYVSASFDENASELNLLHRTIIPRLRNYAAPLGWSVSVSDCRYTPDGPQQPDAVVARGSLAALEQCKASPWRSALVLFVGDRYGDVNPASILSVADYDEFRNRALRSGLSSAAIEDVLVLDENAAPTAYTLRLNANGRLSAESTMAIYRAMSVGANVNRPVRSLQDQVCFVCLFRGLKSDRSFRLGFTQRRTRSPGGRSPSVGV
jgi:hypothetical protein